MYTNKFYHEFSYNKYSQNGEDGIIEELLKRLNINNGWVCEFGAWDGIHLSNTFNLIEKGNFKGVFIEGDKPRFQDLLKTQEKYPNIVAVEAFVDHDPSSDNTLDKLLAKTEIPVDFDILSVDIDSYDYQVWDSVEKYQPKMVIIEINSAINPSNEKHIHFPFVCQGTAFLPMLKLAEKKGYKFILHTGNMFFVKNELFDQLNINYTNPLENYLNIYGCY
jgi:hypothetical protein